MATKEKEKNKSNESNHIRYHRKELGNGDIDSEIKKQLKTSKKQLPTDFFLQTPQVKNKDSCGNILLPSPLKNTSLSPASIFLKSNVIKTPFSLGESAGIEEESEPAISGFNGMVRYHNAIIPKDQKNEGDGEGNDELKNIIKNSDNVYNSPNIFLKKNKG